MSEHEHGSSCGSPCSRVDHVTNALNQMQGTVAELQTHLPEMAKHIRHTRRGQRATTRELASLMVAMRDLVQTSQELHSVVHGKDGSPSIRERLHALEVAQNQLLFLMQQQLLSGPKAHAHDEPISFKFSRKTVGKAAMAIGGWLVGLIAGLIQYYTVPR